MPPKTSTMTSSRQPFKPPRPRSTGGASSSSAGAQQNAGQQPSRPITVASSSDEMDSDNAERTNVNNLENSDEDSEVSTSISTSKPPIPDKLLSYLLHENFRHDDTRITKEAMAIIEKYMEVFVREAVAQAMFERVQTAGGKDTGFLEVEDLEKLAPQLLLDF